MARFTGVVVRISMIAVSFAPLLIDAGTGAPQQLTPGEIIVSFDGR